MNQQQTWWVVEYMAGSVRQTLVLASTAKEAAQNFRQIIRVVKFH